MSARTSAGREPEDPLDRIARLERRVERERSARKEAERLLEEKSRALFTTNRLLAQLADELEVRVEERTRELVAERERADHLVGQDHLTGLSNRHSFMQRVEEACRETSITGGSVALFLIDIDDFKTVNETFGEAAGDLVLKTVAARLGEIVGDGLAARHGADEFALLATGLEPELDAPALAARIIEALRQPVGYEGWWIDMSSSIGFAAYPDQALTPDDLLRFSDIALHSAKKNGCAQSVAFSFALKAEVDARRMLELELAEAIESGAIVPWYQPIVDGASGRLIGVEALARWLHPMRGVLAPAHFMSLAEELNLMEPLFRTMLRQATATVAPLVQAGSLDYLSLNVSPSQFRWSGFADALSEQLEANAFPASALVIEITEELIFRNMSISVRELTRLAKRGVRIALDDFGTGYSNIAALKQLPIDWLKLDRSLLAQIERRSVDQEIIRAVLHMARALNVDVVAEGIETQAQADWLVFAGCHRHQGYLYGKPMPFSELVELTARQ